MKKFLFAGGFAALLIAASLLLTQSSTVYSHCEIPCGIYGDLTRITLLYEDIATVEKSMMQITALSKEDPVNVNQIIRWVNNKEQHCDKIQHVVTQYFMTQRIKPATAADGANYEKYVAQLTTLHGMLIHAMKAKQTTDLANIEQLRAGVKRLSTLYFAEADLEHLKQHHPEGK